MRQAGKASLLAVSLLAAVPSSYAVVAYPGDATALQPDGSSLAVKVHGDEFLNWVTTDDGYTVVRNATTGGYEYAVSKDGKLVSSGILAHNRKARGDKETGLLKTIAPNLVPAMTAEGKLLRSNVLSMQTKSRQERANNYTNFRGLVVLIEFNDCKFTRSDANSLFNRIVNEKNFTGFTDEGSSSKEEYTGSVRDYFYDNSMGKFDPQFDVVGPVQVNYSQYDMEQTMGVSDAISEAFKQLDKSVDFSKYDGDKDGTVDMFYVIFAGGGSNFGNDQRLVWPHASYYRGELDGVRFGRYACSTELYGRPTSKTIDGIGTICHEFSHVLGLMDEYDTDYDGSGGQSRDPGTWSVMAGGSYLNQARTPVGYSMFERYQSGFAVPEVLDVDQDVTLPPLGDSNKGYRINSAVDKEYFLLENRQRTKWDALLPGTGMLVFRVDSTDVSVWDSNRINANPDHNYYELVRANPSQNGSDTDGDPFPGSGNVVRLTNFTTPNLRSWSNLPTSVVLSNIAESGENITFRTGPDTTPTKVEDFETMSITTDDIEGVDGRFTKWSFTNGAKVVTPPDGVGDGSRAVAMTKGSLVTTDQVSGSVFMLTVKVYNPSNRYVVLYLQYLDKNGKWNVVKGSDGNALQTIDAGVTKELTYMPNVEADTQFRFYLSNAAANQICYIDDVTFRFDGNENSSVEEKTIAATGTMTVRRVGENVVVNGVADGRRVTLYNVGGVAVAAVEAVDGSAVLPLPGRGFYLVSDGSSTVKVMF